MVRGEDILKSGEFKEFCQVVERLRALVHRLASEVHSGHLTDACSEFRRIRRLIDSSVSSRTLSHLLALQKHATQQLPDDEHRRHLLELEDGIEQSLYVIIRIVPQIVEALDRLSSNPRYYRELDNNHDRLDQRVGELEAIVEKIRARAAAELKEVKAVHAAEMKSKGKIDQANYVETLRSFTVGGKEYFFVTVRNMRHPKALITKEWDVLDLFAANYDIVALWQINGKLWYQIVVLSDPLHSVLTRSEGKKLVFFSGKRRRYRFILDVYQRLSGGPYLFAIEHTPEGWFVFTLRNEKGKLFGETLSVVDMDRDGAGRPMRRTPHKFVVHGDSIEVAYEAGTSDRNSGHSFILTRRGITNERVYNVFEERAAVDLPESVRRALSRTLGNGAVLEAFLEQGYLNYPGDLD